MQDGLGRPAPADPALGSKCWIRVESRSQGRGRGSGIARSLIGQIVHHALLVFALP